MLIIFLNMYIRFNHMYRIVVVPMKHTRAGYSVNISPHKTCLWLYGLTLLQQNG